MKICSKCNEWKSLDNFHKQYTYFRSKCKICIRLENNDRYKEKKYSRSLSKEYRKLKNKKWYEENPGARSANRAKYKAAKINRTPQWLTVEQKNEIKEFYELARNLSWLCNESLEVDHIIPLRGKTVSGLHVPWNMQILPRSENIRKFNFIKESNI